MFSRRDSIDLLDKLDLDFLNVGSGPVPTHVLDDFFFEAHFIDDQSSPAQVSGSDDIDRAGGRVDSNDFVQNLGRTVSKTGSVKLSNLASLDKGTNRDHLGYIDELTVGNNSSSSVGVAITSGGGAGVYYPEGAHIGHHPSFDKTFDKDLFFRRLSVGSDMFGNNVRKDDVYDEILEDLQQAGIRSSSLGSGKTSWTHIEGEYDSGRGDIDLSAYKSLAEQLEATSATGITLSKSSKVWRAVTC